MTDMTLLDEIEPIGPNTAPPLCLVHYFGAETAHPPERHPKPPGAGVVGRIAERHGNVIVLEFAPPPKAKRAKPSREKLFAKIANALFLLLLLICVLGCVAAFRF